MPDSLAENGAAVQPVPFISRVRLKNYKSIVGTFSFDPNGDTTNRVISVYQVKGGKWVWADQEIAQ